MTGKLPNHFIILIETYRKIIFTIIIVTLLDMKYYWFDIGVLGNNKTDLFTPT